MRIVSFLFVGLLAPACGDSDAPPSWYYRAPPDADGTDAGEEDSPGTDARDDVLGDAADETSESGSMVTSCEFDYDSTFTYQWVAPLAAPGFSTSFVESVGGPDRIVHPEPAPPSTSLLGGRWRDVDPSELVMPDYDDDMPLFERAGAWSGTRCFETPQGVRFLTEEEAYGLYRDIAVKTTGIAMSEVPEVRSVVGLRGTYAGRFSWNGNQPNRFNDTLVLLWAESDGTKHVREFPVNTDTGAKDFGYHSSSSLRANRRYRYVNGWHRGYNALSIDESGYRVRDDGNKNGHWDSDRNGWLPPAGNDDHDRTGSAHNIHMGSLNAPLGSAAVDSWSAGCQVIPGMTNWTEFITHAWTELGDEVEYFLVDTRDIPEDVWAPCTPDGSHACPYPIESLPFNDTRNTATQGASSFDLYNCSTVDESGPEVVYVVHFDTEGTLRVSVDCEEPVDIDVYLLEGVDANACVARDHTSFEYAITPGRYVIVADTYAEAGSDFAGEYTLSVTLE